MRGAPRHLLIPNANSPELLTRLLDMIGRGVRSTRGLAEALGVETRTVHYYTQAGEWLGLIDVADACELTALGLEYVYAGDDRPRVYARAVWQNPMVAELLVASDDALPTVKAIATSIAAIAPEMSGATVRRRASAIRGLIAPAIGQPRARAPEEGRQMALPFLAGGPTATHPAPTLKAVGGKQYSPDAYRFLLSALLDHGELGLSQVRGLLDRAGAERAPIGGYVDMAMSRGDAERIDEVIAATPAAALRVELVESTTSIILSDPGYRAYLDDCRLAATDRQAAIRRDQVAPRYAGWDTRLLGHALVAATLEANLEGVLLDRPLSTFPLAVRGSETGSSEVGAFLDLWEEKGLRVACPPALAQLQGGIAAVNRMLRSARRSPDATRAPGLVDTRRAVHGGLLHPGESLPKAVPDTRSLRVRVLHNAPYVSLCGALLLAHRQQPHRLVVHRTGGRWTVRLAGRPLGPVLDRFDDFARSRGWIPIRRPSGGLPDAALFDALEALGIASCFGKQAVLSERFFGQLRQAPEESELYAKLAPLVGALADHLEAS